MNTDDKYVKFLESCKSELVDLKDAEKLEGKLVIFWNNEEKEVDGYIIKRVAKVVSVVKDEYRFTYRLVGNTDSPEIKRRYDVSQVVHAYPGDSLDAMKE